MAGTTDIGRVRPSPESSRGKRAGRYVLGDLLGRGGMAEVFAGHAIGDHGFQKPVAIKRLLPELANDSVFVERLIQEAKILVGMQHGNIVSVLDLARDGEDVFLVMEFVDGPSLRQLLKSRGTRGLSLGVASYVVQAAAAGLEFAHARPGGAIIHADISPSNLLLTTSGEVRVADFGIARREGGGHGVVEGKWAYMAPEQARGEPLSPRSDVFALGVVLYELVTGAHPFGQQITAGEREADAVRIIPPRVVKPSVPHGLDAICMRALATDPRDRYARMQHMIDAIMDERFANQWREGASDLAHAIREGAPESASQVYAQPRTMITDRPVTIVTRSLISELTPARRSSKKIPRPAATPAPEAFSAPMPSSIAPTELFTPRPDPAEVAPTPMAGLPVAQDMFEIPPALRVDAPMMPAFRMSHANLPGQDLASVHGGSLHGAPPQLAVGLAGDPPRANRWAIGVLSIAAVLGVIAAVALHVGPRDSRADTTPDPQPVVVAQQTTQPVTQPVIDPAQAPPPAVEQPTSDVTTAASVTAPPPPTNPDSAAAQTAQEPAPQPPTTPTHETTTPSTPTPGQDETEDGGERPRPNAAAKKRKPAGVLRLNAVGWAWVRIDGGSQHEVVGAKFSLAPGRHTLRAYNDTGAMKTHVFTIESSRVKTLKIDLELGTIREID